MKGSKAKALTHCFIPNLSNNDWTIRRRDDRPRNPAFQRINICSIKFHSKHSTVLLLYLLRNLMEQTLPISEIDWFQHLYHTISGMSCTVYSVCAAIAGQGSPFSLSWLTGVAATAKGSSDFGTVNLQYIGGPRLARFQLARSPV